MRKIWCPFVIVILGSSMAFADATMTYHNDNWCVGEWQAQVATYNFTNGDRRNYYRLFLKTFAYSAAEEFAGPWEEDTHCEGIAHASNGNYWLARGCLNSGAFSSYCSEEKLTNTILIPRQFCRISGGNP